MTSGEGQVSVLDSTVAPTEGNSMAENCKQAQTTKIRLISLIKLSKKKKLCRSRRKSLRPSVRNLAPSSGGCDVTDPDKCSLIH